MKRIHIGYIASVLMTLYCIHNSAFAADNYSLVNSKELSCNIDGREIQLINKITDVSFDPNDLIKENQRKLKKAKLKNRNLKLLLKNNQSNSVVLTLEDQRKLDKLKRKISKIKASIKELKACSRGEVPVQSPTAIATRIPAVVLTTIPVSAPTYSSTMTASPIPTTFYTPTAIASKTHAVLPECGDGIDNDGDGAVDFPADNDCVSAGDLKEASDGIIQSQCYVREICGNGIDDNCDRAIDESDCLELNARITRRNGADYDHTTLIDYAYAAGQLVDSVNFENDAVGNFIEKNGTKNGSSWLEWDYNVPAAGYYVISMKTWARADRTYKLSIKVNGSFVPLTGIADSWLEYYLVNLPSAGIYRIRAEKLLYGVAYPKHSRIFSLRRDPVAISNSPSQRLVANKTRLQQEALTDWVKFLANDVMSDAKNLRDQNDIAKFDVCSSRDNLARLADLAVAYLLTDDPTIANFGIEALRRTYKLQHWYCSSP